MLNEDLSAERKRLQESGDLPGFYTTAGYQLLLSKYLMPGETPRERYSRVAEAAGAIADRLYPASDVTSWARKFFDIMWKGWLAPSTPVLLNMDNDRGLPVSCGGNTIGDSIDGFYTAKHEMAMLSKNGFGTSSYLGDIRPRGSAFSGGGTALGVVPVIKGIVADMGMVSQGASRRGSHASYLPADHGDFWELAELLHSSPDSLNIGWNISDEFLAGLASGDQEMLARYRRILYLRRVTGRGYMFMVDKVNRMAPDQVGTLTPSIKASNLCVEIALPADEEHSFSCVLSSMNAATWDEWKDTDAIFTATVFLDCVNQRLLDKGSFLPGLDKTVRFAEKARALGLGILGLHELFQTKEMPFDSLPASYLNSEIFENLQAETLRASEWMAEQQGEPEWLKGSGRRNLTLQAIAPNTQSALLAGGVSQGIEPFVSNVYSQNLASGTVQRFNPVLLRLLKARGINPQDKIRELLDSHGSVADVDWLGDEEKKVFRTAFEIDQHALVRMASGRQRFIDQGQSLNLFFSSGAPESYVSEVHKAAIMDPRIKGLYYVRSQSGLRSGSDVPECDSCAS